MPKTIEVPWLIGDECWTLKPVTTYGDPVPCVECGGKGEHKTAKGNIRQCPDCNGRKQTFPTRVTHYTAWCRVSWLEIRHGLHLPAPHISVSVIQAYRNENGSVSHGTEGFPVALGQIFKTEEDAIKYAESKGYEWHPAIQEERP